MASLKTAESQQWEPGGNEVTDKVCYWNVHLLNGRTLILDTDHWWRGHLDWWLFNQVRLLIEWQSRIPFKVHNSSTPREGLPGSSQPASENKSFVSPPPPPHDSWVLLLCLQQLQPLWCRWEIQGERSVKYLGILCCWLLSKAVSQSAGKAMMEARLWL